MLLRRLSAWFGLAVYLTAVLVYPELHRLHHVRFGADHVHGSLGTVYQSAAPADERTVSDHHAAFDLDLASLGLADVAQAGALTVDCALAAYTGVDCAAARPEHEHNFGDELFARHHQHRHEPDFDPQHGAGSLEHLGASVLASRTFVLPPPAVAASRLVVDARPLAPSLAPRRTHQSRGPPPLA